MMIFDLPSLGNYIIMIILNLFFFFFLYIKYIKSFFDPVFYSLVIYFAFTSSMMFIVDAVDISDLAEYFVFQWMFFFGFAASQKIFLERGGDYCSPLTRKSLNFLSWLTTISFVLVSLANIYFYSKHGLAILADDPTVEKVASFTNEGWVRRINWGIGVVPIVGSLILIAANKNKKTFMVILLVSIVFLVVSGSKSALVPVVLFSYILASHKTIINYQNAKKIMALLPMLFILAVFSALLVLTRGQDGLVDAVFALINRLLYNGDVIIYYYDPGVKQYFADYHFGMYFYDLFNGILGMLRIVPYEEPAGYQMVNIYNNYKLPFDTVLGPNIPFFISADMYFGAFFGSFYAFFVGVVVGASRAFFLRSNTNAVYLMLLAILYLKSFSFIIDAGLFMNQFFDFLIVFIFIFSSVYLLFQVSKPKKEDSKC